MSAAKACILTVTGGSSSTKFALFKREGSLRRVPVGGIERIGLLNPVSHAKRLTEADSRVTVRVLHANEELMISQTVCKVLGVSYQEEN
jgi:acetate kinase